MATLYPLRFDPIFRRYIWGGKKLNEVLGKPTGNEPCAESWELVDHGEDQSRVVDGPLAGTSLAELVAQYPRELFGQHASRCNSAFPLLFKFLDAAKALSVQVHPNDSQALQLDPPDLGKTEAWLILAADVGSKIYAGLKRGFDRQALAQEISRGTTELCLHWFEPKAGDCVFIPAGTVHALGAGLLVAEIQQASDTTYRLFDWNRLDADGNSRELHIEQGLDVIDFDTGPVNPITPQSTDKPHVERLVNCDRFVLDRWQFDTSQGIGGDDSFHIFVVLDGEVQLQHESTTQTITRGTTVLLPAELDNVTLTPQPSAIALDIYLPD